MLARAYTRQFERDLKRLRRGGYDLPQLKTVMASLISREPLESRFKNHKLTGNWQGRRECHIRPNWLLMYKVDPEANLIIFERTGSYSDLFR
jgi:mRNA interferase YafQ